jgi:quercetin dioxygenase-like cupin family protein
MQLIRAAHKANTASKQPTETFTGTVHMDPIFTADDCMGKNDCFTPGARTFWHTHERGQILTVTIGTGFVCSKGEAPRKLLVGDVVHIPAGETHWHGATSSTIMAHTAISLGSKLMGTLCGLRLWMFANEVTETSWREEVEQAEYDKAHEVAE